MSQRPPTESDIPMHGWKPYSDLHRERIRAHTLHAPHGGSVEVMTYRSDRWLPILTEELGEVAKEICERNLGNTSWPDSKPLMRTELVQLGAMTVAWIDAIDEDGRF